MPIDTKITCDFCDRDLTYTNNSIDYRLALTSECIRRKSGIVTDMMVYPAIKQDAYFCDLTCLFAWVEKQKFAAQKPSNAVA